MDKPTSAFRALSSLAAGLLFAVTAASAQPSAFQGFENPSDLSCWLGDGTITMVGSFGGTYAVPSFEGFNHAEITNQDDAYQAPGYGDSKYTEFCIPPSGLYTGDFSQRIAVYINANWAPAAAAGVPSFWIDEAPRDTSGAIADGATANSTAEHNFRFTATGTSVLVAADDQAPFATITKSGWYVFQMTWRKDAIATNPVISDLQVYNDQSELIGSTTRPAFMVGAAPPLKSSDLGSSGYLWFTVWQNGFAGDTLAIDNAGVGPTTAPPVPTPGFLFFYWFFAES